MSILICYDGSRSAKEAIAVAANTLASNEITLLHVWDRPGAVRADVFRNPDVVAGPSFADRERDWMQHGQTIVSEGQDLARSLGVEVDERLEPARVTVWRTILDVAHELASELIVVGTRGRTAVQPNLLGFVAVSVVHHSDVPVLVVPMPLLTTATPMHEKTGASHNVTVAGFA
jgi:nucleotide-binding universal stress UspA family protein